MVALYLTSSAAGSGKTSVAAGIGKQLTARGKKVGFFKPILSAEQKAGEDAALMKDIFGLDEPTELISPSFADERALSSNAKSAFDKVSEGKDVVLIEGMSGKGNLTRDLASTLDAFVVPVEAYSADMSGMGSRNGDTGKRLIGIVVNRIPRSRLAREKARLSEIDKSGVNLLGAVPDDRLMLSLTVAELIHELNGEIISDGDTSPLVENVMLGAMTPDPGATYYGRKDNKAVVLKSSRPDMQLAALSTSTKCVVLSGEAAPAQTVLAQAEKNKVPLVSVKADVNTVVTVLEQALRKSRFNRAKASRASEIVGQHLDLGRLYKELGL